MKTKKILRNISYSFFANIFSLLVSGLVVLIVPKFIGITEYGYYQLYIFYASYIGFFHFGWVDGIYLKYGGIHYEKYNFKLMSSQFWYLLVFEIGLMFIFFMIINVGGVQGEKSFILSVVSFSLIIAIPKTLLTFFLQTSNRIKEYSLMIIIEKVIYVLLSIVLIFMKAVSYEYYIFADVIGKFIAVLLGIYYCKEIVFSKMTHIKESLLEAKDNISIGMKLLIANIASMLIVGVVRMAIENKWSIEIFGKVSLALNLSNFLMVCINSIGIVLFPMLKRTEKKELVILYDNIRNILMITLFFMLLCFYPMNLILNIWLPDYRESLTYLAILFPMCVYECKMSLLVNTYMKAYRKEKGLLLINAITVVLTLTLTIISVYFMENLALSIINIVFVLMFRSILSEYILCKYMKLNYRKDTIWEITLSFLFIIANFFCSTAQAFILYFITYLIYCIFKRKKFQNYIYNYKGK